MDATQSSARAIQTEETALLRQRTQKTDAARRLTGLITVSGTLVGVVFLALSGFAIQREMDAKAGVRAQLNVLNAELEQRVEQRTAALRESQDRLRESSGRPWTRLLLWTVNSASLCSTPRPRKCLVARRRRSWATDRALHSARFQAAHGDTSASSVKPESPTGPCAPEPAVGDAGDGRISDRGLHLAIVTAGRNCLPSS